MPAIPTLSDDVSRLRTRQSTRFSANLEMNRQLEIDASEIRFRAARRVGEMMAEQREHENERAINGSTALTTLPISARHPI